MACCICFEDKPPKLVQNHCDSCQSNTCNECTEAQGKPECANCRKPWPFQSFPALKFAKVQRSYHEDNLFLREKTLLPKAQVYLDWILAMEEYKRQARFGHRNPAPQKPAVDLSTEKSSFFPCPSNECRGFLTFDNGFDAKESSIQCLTCHKNVCVLCREISTSGHQCNKDTLASVLLLKQDSKSCPQCAALVQKTAGCDHMFCTQCRNHFSWKTGEPLKTSTNGHQNNTMAQKKAEDLNLIQMKSNHSQCQATDLSDQKTHAVPINMIPIHLHTSLVFHYLQVDAATVRYLQESKQSQRLAKYNDELQNLRVKFLRNQLDENAFKSKLFLLEQNFSLKQWEASIVCLILQVLNDLQWQWTYLQKFSEEGTQIILQSFVRFVQALHEIPLGHLVLHPLAISLESIETNSSLTSEAFHCDIPFLSLK